MRQEKRKKKGGERAKSKSQDCCVKFCFLRMPELRKLIFCIWIRRPRSVRPVNRFVALYSTTVTRKPLDQLQNAFFGKISRSEWVKRARKDLLLYKLIQVGGYFAYIIPVTSSCSSINSKMAGYFFNFLALYTVSFSIIIYVLWLNSTDHVRAPKTLTFKIRLSAQSFL